MTTDDIMALANKYAASNGKALLEKLYGTSQSYTEQCAAEAFQDRQALREAIDKLVAETRAAALEDLKTMPTTVLTLSANGVKYADVSIGGGGGGGNAGCGSSANNGESMLSWGGVGGRSGHQGTPEMTDQFRDATKMVPDPLAAPGKPMPDASGLTYKQAAHDLAVELATIRTAIRKLHAAKGRYHTQLAACDLFDLAGLPNERPTK